MDPRNIDLLPTTDASWPLGTNYREGIFTVPVPKIPP